MADGEKLKSCNTLWNECFTLHNEKSLVEKCAIFEKNMPLGRFFVGLEGAEMVVE